MIDLVFGDVERSWRRRCSCFMRIRTRRSPRSRKAAPQAFHRPATRRGAVESAA